MCLPCAMLSQVLIEPSDDLSFVREYRNDDEYGVITKNGFVVSMNAKSVNDDYGKFYQISVLIQNLTDQPCIFNPDSIVAYVIKGDSAKYPMKVYSAKSFQKKIKNDQMWTQALLGMAAGLNAGQAAYQTTYVPYKGYGGHTYMQPVTTYNAGAASIANMTATSQMIGLAKQMETDRKIRDNGYLKKNTIHSGEGVFGYMNIKRKKGKQMTVVVIVNGTTFEFKWNISKKDIKKGKLLG